VNRHELLDTREPQEILLFVLDRQQIIDEVVLVLWILKYLNLIEEILLCFFPGAVSLELNSLSFQELKKRFGCGVIMAIPTSAHACCR
jgi:hypothetical protein